MSIPQNQEIIDAKEQRNVSWGGVIKSHTLFDEISSLENLFLAWREFLRGKRGRRDVQEYGLRLEDNLFALHEHLRSGTWKHGGYEQFRVCDPKPRIIHKASVADRIIHHAVVRVIEPIFERSFMFNSWSCRKGKGTHGAVMWCQSELNRISKHGKKPVWVIKCDIKKYFENIDNDILLGFISRKIQDQRTYELIRQIISSFKPGLPLGNLTSQLFANIYLNSFDHYSREVIRPLFYIRYCDDFILVHHSRDWLIEQIPKIKRYVSQRLNLTLHPHKIILRPFRHGIDWLGYVLYPDRRMMRPRTRQRMWQDMNKKIDDYLVGATEYESLRSTFSSYDGILKVSWNGDDREELDILRTCVW